MQSTSAEPGLKPVRSQGYFLDRSRQVLLAAQTPPSTRVLLLLSYGEIIHSRVCVSAQIPVEAERRPDNA